MRVVLALTHNLMITIDSLWNSRNEDDWKRALQNYWNFVHPGNIALERELNDLKIETITSLDSIGWYDFLHDKYFRWKYTAPNRYASTTLALRRYKDADELDRLYDIKKRLLNLTISDISRSLSTATQIRGLGIAGSSGLLSLMYPGSFATVDQFAVKALCEIHELPEREDVAKMRPENLTLRNGITLVNIMRSKAQTNNSIFETDFWTPRKIDMVLWASRS